MIVDSRTEDIRVWAPAKVNLHLEVLGKREDGYHEIATLMVSVGLYDSLLFKEEMTSRIQIECSDPNLSSGPENLVYKAADLLRRKTGETRGARILLTKRIPMAAGLGGGSSDAAATLAGLNQLWNLDLGKSQLAGYAAEIGSDVAFFFSTPAAWCTGRGEKVTPLNLGITLWFVLICPPFGCSTAEIYQNVIIPSQARTGEEMRQAVEKGNLRIIADKVHNRLQEAADKKYPLLRHYREQLGEAGSLAEMLSGSGSTLFALCQSAKAALQLAKKIRQSSHLMPGTMVYAVRSSSE